MKHKIKKNKYLILDLDETLVFTTKKKINKNSILIKGKSIGYVTLRPHVKKFI